jgi:hypothetical protein
MEGVGGSDSVAGLTCKAMLQVGIAAGAILYSNPVGASLGTVAIAAAGAGVLGNAVHETLKLSMDNIGARIRPLAG